MNEIMMYYDPAYQEHLDHEMGRMTDEQNAIALSRSRMNLCRDESKITEALKAGKSCLVSEWPEYCPMTDAVIGNNVCLVRTFDDPVEAARKIAEILLDRYCDEERYYLRYPVGVEPEPLPELSDEEIPF
jgi:hypothetical protein